MSFPAYPEYKDSGVEWLGMVPAHWDVQQLRRLFGVANGSTPKSDEPSYWDGDIVWVTPDDLASIEDGYIETSRRKLTQLGYESCGTEMVPAGSLVLSTRAPIGYVAVGLTDLCVNQGCRALQPAPGECSRFWYYVIIAAREELQMRGQGATFTEISRAPLLSLRLPVPHSDERYRIPLFLDHETARIDALIEEQQRLIELLKEKRQAVISHAVTKGLDPNVSMKDSGVEWLGQVPAHWGVAKLGFYVEILTGYPFPSSGFSSDGGDIALLRGANVGVSYLKWIDTVYWPFDESDDFSEYVMREGQIVIGMDRPWIGGGLRIARVRSVDTPCLLLQRVAAISSRGDIDEDYLFSLFDSGIFKAYVEPDLTGVSVPHVSPEQIMGFVVPLPPITEQKEIANHITEEIGKIDELLGQTEVAIDLLAERRSALISAAVTGKIDVRDWQPPKGHPHTEAVADVGASA